MTSQGIVVRTMVASARCALAIAWCGEPGSFEASPSAKAIRKAPSAMVATSASSNAAQAGASRAIVLLISV